jgi:hypothetical protein
MILTRLLILIGTALVIASIAAPGLTLIAILFLIAGISRAWAEGRVERDRLTAEEAAS